MSEEPKVWQVGIERRHGGPVVTVYAASGLASDDVVELDPEEAREMAWSLIKAAAILDSGEPSPAGRTV